MIIAFIGVIGSGKNYQQDLLTSRGAVALDFKDALIAMCSGLVGYDIRKDYDLFKETIAGMSAPGAPIHKCMQREPARKITIDVLANYPLAMTGRRMLQRLGTDVMRAREPNYWADQWVKKARELVSSGISIACADARFINEIQAIKTLTVLPFVTCEFIFCNYKSDRYNATDPHPSESLAQKLLRSGCVDGQKLSYEEILRASY